MDLMPVQYRLLAFMFLTRKYSPLRVLGGVHISVQGELVVMDTTV